MIPTETTTEARRELPKGWRWARLGDVCEIQLGKMLSPASKTGKAARPYLRNANVQWGRIDLEDLAEMDFDEQEEQKFGLRAGDLLVCEGGEPGRAAVWEAEIYPCYYQKALHRLRARNGEVDPYFLMYRFWLGSFEGEFVDSHAQTTIAHLPVVRLQELIIQLPPLPEQRRIAALLGEQLAAVERARAAAEARLEAARALPAAYLRERFEGEEARGWPRKRLGNVCALLPAHSIATQGEATVRAITTACLTEAGFDPDGVKTARMRSEDAQEALVRPGEVLIARSNTPQLVGRVARYTGNPPGVVASDLTIRIWPSSDIDGRFLTFYLSTLFLSGYWQEHAGGASGSMKKITRSQLVELAVPCPGLLEQQKVAALLEQQLAAVRVSAEILRSQRDAVEQLPAALLRQAFSGEL